MAKTALNKITDRAKIIRKSHPSMKWTDAIKKASVELKKKTPAKRKSVIKKRKIHQTGTSKKRFDVMHKALPPGKRKSKAGRVYYEYRKNRSDMPNTLTGISNVKLIGAIKERVELTMGKAYINFHNAKKMAEKKRHKKIIAECKSKLKKLS